MDTTNFVIVYEEVEKDCKAYELINTSNKQSKFIPEEQAMELERRYSIPLYEMYQWVRKQKLAEIRKDLPF